MAVRFNIPPVTRLLLVLLLLLSFLYTAGRYRKLPGVSDPRNTGIPLVPYLTLVPKLCFYYPWTLVSATFVERTLVSLLVNGANIFFGGKYLERAWGSREFAKVVLVASLIPNATAVLTYYIWTSFSSYRAYTPVSGGVTLQAAFLVAFKQLVPEHTVSLFKGVIKMRVKHFPAIFLLVNTLSGLLFGTDTAAIFAWVGLVTSWTYLRFYKRQPDLSGSATTASSASLKGDASETFAFASFFPDKIQPPIAAVCDQIYILLTNVGICTPFSTEEIESGNQQAAARGEAGLPSLLGHGVRTGRGSGRREEAERRRALALQALDQRLSAAHANKPAPSATQPVAAVSVAPTLAKGQDPLGRMDYISEEGDRS